MTGSSHSSSSTGSVSARQASPAHAANQDEFAVLGESHLSIFSSSFGALSRSNRLHPARLHALMDTAPFAPDIEVLAGCEMSKHERPRIARRLGSEKILFGRGALPIIFH